MKPVKIIKTVSQCGVFSVGAYCLADRVPRNYWGTDLEPVWGYCCFFVVNIEKKERYAIVVGEVDHESAVRRVKASLEAVGMYQFQVEDCTDIPSTLCGFEGDRIIQAICSQ
jgi:hypothetical protein